MNGVVHKVITLSSSPTGSQFRCQDIVETDTVVGIRSCHPIPSHRRSVCPSRLHPDSVSGKTVTSWKDSHLSLPTCLCL